MARLSEVDAALLDFLRRGERTANCRRQKPSTVLWRCSLKVAALSVFSKVDSEPPRVRAIFGAIGEQIGKPPDMTQRLRASLNPFSKFDFGLLTGLPSARHWQAKES